MVSRGAAADFETGATAYRAGKYEEALALVRAGGRGDPEWVVLAIDSLMALGKYSEAATIARSVQARYGLSPDVQLAVYRALYAIGDRLNAMNSLAAAAHGRPGGFDPTDTPAATVARAEALGLLQYDPKDILTKLLDPAAKAFPDDREPAQATGELGLAKHDYQLAAEAFQNGLKKYPDDPDLNTGLAHAYTTSNPEQAMKFAEVALATNPRHEGALLLKAEILCGQREFAAAGEPLDALLTVNPAHPEAFAWKAVIAHLTGKPEEAAVLRDKALDVWSQNPRVDYLIGSNLAKQYRFAEGIDFLRQALEADPDDLDAHFDLGSNLLRFGAEDDGWKHIETVRERDPYHVAAFNLVTLRDQMKTFETAERDGVRVRMAPLDMQVFGERALEISAEAKTMMAEKYQTPITFPVTVEIFPEQQDFAVRTFEMPGGEGFLGVCFGPLITACSPRGQLGRANWESVLWHEMVHTITLAATRHRIPRWLTEGISVYEERLANPGWGQWMTSSRRAAIEQGKFMPIADLDSLFRKDIDLAYFQSSLVVEYLVERFGNEALKKILADLARDRPINEALVAHTAPLDQLDTEFMEQARAEAAGYGSGMDWKPLTDAEFDAFSADPGIWVAQNPARYQAVMIHARKLAEASSGKDEWRVVRGLLEPLIALEPDNREPENPYLLLAQSCREIGDPAAERAALEKLATLDAGAEPAFARLIELTRNSGDDAQFAINARRMLAVDPFDASALRAVALRGEQQGDYQAAATAYASLLATEPADAGKARFDRARVLHRAGDSGAKREVLTVLEANPRHREALALLLEMQRRPPGTNP